MGDLVVRCGLGALALVVSCALPGSGCALSHERARPDASSPHPAPECPPGPIGAITYCRPCEREGCCLRVCQPDGTWSACGFVENACPDASATDGGPSDRDR